MAERHYSREEMQAILARAIEQQAHGATQDDLSHAQLVETAREVGLSPAEIATAVAEVDARRARDVVVARLQVRQRQRLRNHAVAYVAVNLGLWAIDFLTATWGSNQQPGWHWLVAMSWGIGLALHVWRTFAADPASLARDAERWQARRQRKIQKQKMQQAIEVAVSDVVEASVNAYSRLVDPQRRRNRDRRGRDRDPPPRQTGNGPVEAANTS